MSQELLQTRLEISTPGFQEVRTVNYAQSDIAELKLWAKTGSDPELNLLEVLRQDAKSETRYYTTCGAVEHFLVNNYGPSAVKVHANIETGSGAETKTYDPRTDLSHPGEHITNDFSALNADTLTSGEYLGNGGVVYEVSDPQNRSKILVSIPSPDWRQGKDSEVQTDLENRPDQLIGIEQISVVRWVDEGIPYHEILGHQPGQELSSLSDFYIRTLEDYSALENMNPREIIDRHLLEIYSQGGEALGSEVEFFVFHALKDTERSTNLAYLIGKYQKEHFDRQGEFAPPPSSTLPELRLQIASEMRELIQTVVQDEALVSFSGTASALGDAAEYRINDHHYVRFMAQKFIRYMVNSTELLGDEERSIWAQVSAKLGFGSLEELIWGLPEAGAYPFSAGHHSLDLPHDNKGGCLTSFVTMESNLWSYFSPVLDVPSFSGSTLKGTDVRYAGDRVESSRRIAARIMAVSNISTLIPVENDTAISDLQINMIIKGISHTPDRASGVIELLDREGQLVQLPATHGISRARVSQNILSFVSASTFGQWEQYTASLRHESTSLDQSQSLEKLSEAWALRKVVRQAALFAAQDGYRDIFTWLRDKTQSDLDPQQTSNGNGSTRAITNRLNEALVGRYDKTNIDLLLGLNDYVATRVRRDLETLRKSQPETSWWFDESIFALSKNNLLAQKTIDTYIEEAGLAGAALYFDFIANPTRYPNTGSVYRRLELGDIQNVVALIIPEFSQLNINLPVPDISLIAERLRQTSGRTDVSRAEVEEAYRGELILYLDLYTAIKHLGV